MNHSEIAGAVIVGLPAVIIAYLAFWRANRPMFWFVMALVAVGLGYLGSTGALADIADTVINSFPFPLPTVG